MRGMLLDEGFPLPQWSAEAHLKLMDETGITTSVFISWNARHTPHGETSQTCQHNAARTRNHAVDLSETIASAQKFVSLQIKFEKLIINKIKSS